MSMKIMTIAMISITAIAPTAAPANMAELAPSSDSSLYTSAEK